LINIIISALFIFAHFFKIIKAYITRTV